MFFLCRNRLESNTEHWNALLLSLRELIEWVIRKDTELTGLGPVCGDVAALQKQQATDVLHLCLYERRQLIRNTDIYVFSSRLNVPPHGNVSFNYIIALTHRCSLSRYFCFTIYASPLQDDHRGFRRQLEDKRPVVENNLLSGRQYIANEPPLSDTSDSEVIIVYQNVAQLTQNIEIAEQTVITDDNNLSKFRRAASLSFTILRVISDVRSRNNHNDVFVLRKTRSILITAAACDFAHSVGSHVSRNVRGIGCNQAGGRHLFVLGKRLTLYFLFAFSIAGRELDGDSRGYRSAEEQARELTRSIRREVNKLSEQWNALIERSDAWKRKLDDTANRFHLSERLCALEFRCVPGQSTLVSRLMPPKSQAHVFFDIGNSSHFRDESGEKTRSNIQRRKSVERLHQRMHFSSLMQTLRNAGSCIRPRTKKSLRSTAGSSLRRNRL
ncbi:Dystrophin, isoform D [Cyphomyrmex costatus]|uniref:Dystrophin, isoform D n=1 Tax=Cyphomyrmex costatus TaxID=456900 RepID=A0A195CLI3_9HYME|nr:Dystrophin, isoform D [Cyphomyrmex costatus]